MAPEVVRNVALFPCTGKVRKTRLFTLRGLSTFAIATVFQTQTRAVGQNKGTDKEQKASMLMRDQRGVATLEL
jgi:hypothetical protein